MGNYISKGPRNQPERVPTGTICDKIINNLSEKNNPNNWIIISGIN